ncbi:putative chromatin remodeling & transcription regulator BTB-POZ family [Helianthus annuus]|nr:putative chromatin remodeling & transcription regulator BTB-POZ family [Helianthus annuus]
MKQRNKELYCNLSNGGTSPSYFPPDVTFYLHGRPIEAHRVILSARSPYFQKKFETDWRDRKEIRFSREKLSYPAFYSLVHFFYSDRLEKILAWKLLRR